MATLFGCWETKEKNSRKLTVFSRFQSQTGFPSLLFSNLLAIKLSIKLRYFLEQITRIREFESTNFQNSNYQEPTSLPPQGNFLSQIRFQIPQR
ncbi:hypothetical protein NC652_026671 [Populus alba x Populus x berolinensis]|nr:hypothetical protein NC652_026671 [Populus alba x Populus x berolinensis]